MRLPTEYIAVAVSIGALSLVAFSVLSTPTPTVVTTVTKPERIIGGVYTPLREGTFSTKSLSELLSSLEWSITTPSEVEGTIKKNNTSKPVAKMSEPEEEPKSIAVQVVSEVAKAVAEPLPQSALKLETFQYYNSSLVEKDPISFATTVTNTGDTFSATSTFAFTFDEDSDGIVDIVLAQRSLEPLIPGETKAESWKNALLPVPGTHTVAVCIVALEEVDEAENCSSLKFTVVPQDPDLTVKPLSIIPESPIAGDTISVSSILRNQGKGRADNSLTRLRIDAQNNGTWDIVSYFETAVIESGTSVPKEWVSAWRSVHGLVKIEVCTDHEEVLEESDEENNCRNDVFRVIPGDYTGAESVTFTIEDGVLSPLSHSVVPGGIIIFSNRDSESYSISGDMGSTFLSPETEGSIQAPFYEGTYSFFPLYGASFEGAVIVE